jgi:hypothetical protein
MIIHPVVSQGDISAVRLLVTEGIMIIHPVVSQCETISYRGYNDHPPSNKKQNSKLEKHCSSFSP